MSRGIFYWTSLIAQASAGLANMFSTFPEERFEEKNLPKKCSILYLLQNLSKFFWTFIWKHCGRVDIIVLNVPKWAFSEVYRKKISKFSNYCVTKRRIFSLLANVLSSIARATCQVSGARNSRKMFFLKNLKNILSLLDIEWYLLRFEQKFSCILSILPTPFWD